MFNYQILDNEKMKFDKKIHYLLLGKEFFNYLMNNELIFYIYNNTYPLNTPFTKITPLSFKDLETVLVLTPKDDAHISIES